MKNFIKENLFEPFTEGCKGIFMGISIWIAIGILSLFILFGVDSMFLIYKNGTGVIKAKNFTPKHFKLIGDAIMLDKDEWCLFIEIDGEIDSYEITEEEFNSFKTNQKINVEYSNGRIWKTVYVKQILK